MDERTNSLRLCSTFFFSITLCSDCGHSKWWGEVLDTAQGQLTRAGRWVKLRGGSQEQAGHRRQPDKRKQKRVEMVIQACRLALACIKLR